tara:strand:+ start:2036 stop:2404 length:369 start_codon:yes stop_codon:yes gene_type:complete
MGQEFDIDKLQIRILFALLFSTIISIYVGINYSAMQGYYVFTAFFVLIGFSLIITNFEMVKSKLEISSPKIVHLIIYAVSLVILSSIFNDNLEYPLLPSIGLSIVCLMFVNWTYYSLEPYRG